MYMFIFFVHVTIASSVEHRLVCGWASAEIMAPAAVQKVKNRNDRKLIVLTYLLNEYLNLKKTLISSLIRLCLFCTKHLITAIVCFSLKFSICFMRI